MTFPNDLPGQEERCCLCGLALPASRRAFFSEALRRWFHLACLAGLLREWRARFSTLWAALAAGAGD